MTERGRSAVRREAHRLEVGASSVEWRADALELRVDEITAPWPSRLRGRVVLHAPMLFEHVVTLDQAGRHRWRAIAPTARVEVDLEAPRVRWRGHGYLDTNWGDAPLEDGFRAWHWSRATLADGSTAVLYDVEPHGEPRTCLALRYHTDGAVRGFEAPPTTVLPGTGWGVGRSTRAERSRAAVLRTLEDTPFYARSLLQSRLLGEEVATVHESLSLQRFRSRWVQWLLPFRMPRRAG